MPNVLSFSKNQVVAIIIPTLMLGALATIMTTVNLKGDNLLQLGLTADLLLTVPLVYFLLIRTTNIPKTTVIPVMIIGLILGSYLLPADGQQYLSLFRTWALPVIELTVLSLLVYKLHKAFRRYKELKGTSPDFFTTLKSVCREILPQKLVLPFATEIGVFYYGFFYWKNKSHLENEFTCHKESGAQVLLAGLILILGIETVALHFLLGLWSTTAAWVLTAISIYSAIQVFGIIRSLPKRPIHIEDGNLMLRWGILNEAEIPLEDITAIELSNAEMDRNDRVRSLSPLSQVEGHNVILRLKRENVLTGFYGIKRTFDVLALHMDNPAEFKEKLESAMN
ncbi:hypothetical protein [Fulvivirga sedimenti]|uniref:Beta-carotene 15,15'-monooxygenase n=1 Tax=Fulvivirga sedimenti TaxID=2879465 RepID=A0A9X1HMK5_9BACT|nr:hypothetical protein [Fulvivirga sedimenti]MCA6073765.1 hypothetical protein [Fulvivirga sedimenti]